MQYFQKNIVISGMSREMGKGRHGHLVKLGSPAQKNSIVDIFSSISEEEYALTDEQEAFYSDWVSALRKL